MECEANCDRGNISERTGMRTVIAAPGRGRCGAGMALICDQIEYARYASEAIEGRRREYTGSLPGSTALAGSLQRHSGPSWNIPHYRSNPSRSAEFADWSAVDRIRPVACCAGS